MFRKLTKFYVEHMLPEILTHTVVGTDEPNNARPSFAAGSNDGSSDVEEKYCHCRKGEQGRMICCENDDCKISWFHFHCFKITRALKGDWFCPDCRN